MRFFFFLSYLSNILLRTVIAFLYKFEWVLGHATLAYVSAPLCKYIYTILDGSVITMLCGSIQTSNTLHLHKRWTYVVGLLWWGWSKRPEGGDSLLYRNIGKHGKYWRTALDFWAQWTLFWWVYSLNHQFQVLQNRTQINTFLFSFFFFLNGCGSGGRVRPVLIQSLETKVSLGKIMKPELLPMHL